MSDYLERLMWWKRRKLYGDEANILAMDFLNEFKIEPHSTLNGGEMFTLLRTFISRYARLEVNSPPIPTTDEVKKMPTAERMSQEEIERLEAKNWSKFTSLVAQWKSERGARSSAASMAMLPSYLKIVGMGPDALPLLLSQLKSEGDQPDHWFLALSSIAEENPVPAKSRGRMKEMAAAWIQWGEEQGYV